MSHNVRLVVFDYDGTLVDSQHRIVQAMIEAFAGHDLIPPAPEVVRRVVGLPLEIAVARLLPEAEDWRTAVTVADRYREAFHGGHARPDHNEPLFPGVRETLALLDKSGVLLGIATGKGRRGLMAGLEGHGLAHHFTTSQTADDGPGKPDPGMLRRAMAEVGATPRETVMVGDTTFDMEMAVNAGVAGIGVGWGYHETDELTTSGAARVIERFDDLVPALSALDTEVA